MKREWESSTCQHSDAQKVFWDLAQYIRQYSCTVKKGVL